jgi:hypothetical protein
MLLTVNMSEDIALQRKLTSVRIEEWLHEDLFHFRWWFLVILFIVSIFLWFKLTDKKSFGRIILYAAFITIITLGLDEIGEELCLWDYPTDVLPVFPPLTAVDLASLPMIYSLIYQYFKTWKNFSIATLVMATIFCFVFEPILSWSDIYQPLTWKYYYGFPIYISMAVCTKFVTDKIFSITKKSKE